MRQLSFLLLVIAGAVVVSAQAPTGIQTQTLTGPPQPEEVQTEEKPGRVEGSVVLAGGEKPVRKAQVTLYSRERRSPVTTTTDENGKFVIEEIPPGDYMFMARHVRYVPFQEKPEADRISRRQISVSPGGTVKGVVFKMMPGAVVTGRVLDEYGDPQPQTGVQIMRYVFRQGQKQLMPMNGGSTDDRGEYRIFNIPPGRYYLKAEYDEQERWARAADAPNAEQWTYPPIFFPGVLEPEMAMAIELRSGEERQSMDFRLVRAGGVRVSGRLLADGKPPRNAMISLLSTADVFPSGRNQQPVDSKNGEFGFSGIRPGSYTLSAAEMGDRMVRRFGRVEIEVGSSNIEDLVVPLYSGATMPGRVLLEGDTAGEPPWSEENPVRVFLSSERGMMMMFGGGGSGTVKDDGSFELENVPPGRYRARLVPVPDGGYLSGVRFGDHEVLGQEIEIGPGSQGPLTLRIRMAAATISGVAEDEDGRPAPDTSILVVPEKSKWENEDLFRFETTDQYGRFTAKNIAPGEYRVYALTRVEPGRHLDPDFLALLEDQGEKVEADEKGSYEVKARVIEMAEEQ